jgi:hypothetical protein
MSREIHPTVPRQLAMLLDASALAGLGAKERAEILSLLAQLLLEAGGRVDEERSDDAL